MRVGQTKDRFEARIDRRSLDIDGSCHFDGLAATEIRVSTQTGNVGLRRIRLSGMPDLGTLDLRECSAGFELHLDANTAPTDVFLPEGGVRIYICITRNFPTLRIHGPIDELIVQCGAAHTVAGMYLFDACEGAMLLPGDAIECVHGIERYIRIDQSARGLQFKDLRRGVSHSSILWKLVDPRTGPLAPIDRIIRSSPDALARFALDNSTEAVEERHDWLESIEKPRLLCRHLLRLLIDRAPPRAIWALRCMLQCHQRGDERAAIVGHALLAAGVTWGTGHRSFRRPEIDQEDLTLVLKCRALGLTRRCERYLFDRGAAAQLPELVRFAARLPLGHPWARDLAGMIEAAIARCLSLRSVRRKSLSPEEWLDRDVLDSFELERILQMSKGLSDRRILARLLAAAEDAWDPDARIEVARKLASNDDPMVGMLVRSALATGRIASRKLRDWAVRYLLGEPA